MSQAAASFVLQVLAVRMLGLAGFGVFALLYGLIILGSAITTGLVGDSLTVLDRSSPRIRAGLQAWLALLALVLATLGTAGASLSSYVGAGAAVAFGAAAAAFFVEDALRRLLMASMRFWQLVVVDLTSMVVSIAVIGTVRVAAGSVELATFFVALLVGQMAAIITAWKLLPSIERWLAAPEPRDMASVWAYGAWRSAQQGVRPLMLTAVRLVVTAFSGLAVFGRLEAARVYVAPAMLIVSGGGSYLFASYARDRTQRLEQLLGRADRAVVTMLASAVLVGAAALAAVPWLGDALSGGKYELEVVAVLGRLTYTAATAAVTPYGSLAAVRGGQVKVFAVRAGESAASVLAVMVTLAAGMTVDWVPMVLAAFAALSGVALRRLNVHPAHMARRTRRLREPPRHLSSAAGDRTGHA